MNLNFCKLKKLKNMDSVMFCNLKKLRKHQFDFFVASYKR